MYGYIVKRGLSTAFSVLGVTFMVFIISHLIPSDPIGVYLGPQATSEQIEALKVEWGLKEPIIVQYGMFLNKLVHGDLGASIVSRKPVMSELIYYFPATFELTLVSMVFAVFGGVVIGVFSALKRNHFIDHFTRIYSIVGISMPIFWLGLLLLFIFYVHLGWFPGGDRIGYGIEVRNITGFLVLDSILTGNWTGLWSSLVHLLLPGYCLSCSILATIARIARSSVLNVVGEDFVQAARAKGISEVKVIGKHVLKNSIMPVLTISGVLYGQLLGGAILTETIFSWPGMGHYVVRSILHLDFQPIMGFTVLCTLLYAFFNLVVDILYSVINPQIRLE